MRPPSQLFRTLGILACISWLWPLAGPLADSRADDTSAPRTPWTQSRVTGSPEPPLPFVLQRAFPELEFDRPVSIRPLPRTGDSTVDRFVVCQQGGQIYSFAAAGDASELDLVADFAAEPPLLSDRQPEDANRIDIYDLAFHPDFQHNRRVVVCYLVARSGQRRADGTHIASFELSSDDPPKLRLDTERTILTFDSGGHNGCTVAFGNDGLLYISTGDAASPTPPDPYNHGQNVGDLYSAILRVDIDRIDPGQGYSVPEDNPFVGVPGARPEVYAYGFRNPWRMSFDRPTGDLWVGDVGWEAWEMVYRVHPGGNYGWPIKEGPGDVRPDATPGPTPISPADIALPHAEAASVTGGVVYRGTQLPEVRGHYIFGDWITRRFWAADFDNQQVLSFREIAAGNVKPICFELDHEGELLILDYNSAGQSGIYRLAPNPAPEPTEPFPTRLSDTGLFSSLAPLRPAPGVVPYTIQAPMFRDGATAKYWLAIPGDGQATFFAQPQRTFDWFRSGVTLPLNSVLVKTYWPQRSAERPSPFRPIETQLAHKVGPIDWNYYSYRWNEEGSDAELVGGEGDSARIEIADPMAPGKRVEVDWIFAARSQCRTCHTPWRGETLGFIEPQLRSTSRPSSSSTDPEDSWTELLDTGWITADAPRPAGPHTANRLVDPHDRSQPLSDRARSYLHANCAHCHLNGGNASVAFDVSFHLPLEKTDLLGAPPMRGDFQLDQAKLLAPAAPKSSVLLYRMAKLGSGRMPPIGNQLVDRSGIALIHRWIDELNDESVAAANTATSQPSSLNSLDDESLQPLQRGETDQGTDSTAATELLDSTSGALWLASKMAAGEVHPNHRAAIVKQALAAPPAIAELFEPWADPADRVERLGPGFDPQQILSLAGDAERGRRSFLAGQGQCSQCHQLDNQGTAVGPDLSKIAVKYPERGQLLAHIIDPSKEIAEEYRAVTLLTDGGQTFTGRILQRTDNTVQLQDATGRLHELRPDQIEIEKPSPQSLMPTQLLDNLSAQQAADLLAYLANQK